MATAEAARESGLASLGIPVYLPSFLLSIGQGAVIPIVALMAVELGAPVAVAAFVVALRGLGTMAFDIPSGLLVERFGDQRCMQGSVLLLVAALVGCALSRDLVVFAGLVFLGGCAWSVWLLARQSYVTGVMPPRLRGRALSTVGGMNRIGLLIGPFVGAGVVRWMDLAGAFYLHAVMGLFAAVALAAGRGPSMPAPTGSGVAPGFRAIMTDHRGTFLVVGFTTMSINLLRESRQVVLPLWAHEIGVSATGVAIVFGISSVVDMAMFYPAGYVSDRWGRRSVALPCLALLSLGHVVLTLAHDFATVSVVGVIMGLGNGLGSGIIMTLGSDFAPDLGRAQFLAVFRLLGDAGAAGGPVAVSAATAIAGLGATVATMGLLGAACTGLVAAVMPETLNTSAHDSAGADGSDRPRSEDHL